MIYGIKQKICLFCIKRASKYMKMAGKYKDFKDAKKYFDKSFDWLELSIYFADEVERECLKNSLIKTIVELTFND